MERLPYIASLVLYALLALDHLVPGFAGGRLRKWDRAVATLGVTVHLGTLIWIATVHNVYPGFPEALSAAGLAAVVAYLMVGHGRMRSLGMLLAPLGLVLLGTSLVVPHHQVSALDQAGASPWLPIHLGLVFAGIGGFFLSFAVGVLYLVVRSRLKKKQFAGLKRLPSLEVLDRILFRSMLFGFVFLTLGIGVGGMWAAASLSEPWSLDPKVLFTLLIWLWYGVGLQFRLVAGWRGRWSALFSIVGFVGLVFSMGVFNFLVQGWHGYGG